MTSLLAPLCGWSTGGFVRSKERSGIFPLARGDDIEGATASAPKRCLLDMAVAP